MKQNESQKYKTSSVITTATTVKVPYQTERTSETTVSAELRNANAKISYGCLVPENKKN